MAKKAKNYSDVYSKEQLNLINTARWIKTRNKRYTVSWCVPFPNYTCDNRFTGQHYMASEHTPICVLGACGEFWMMNTHDFLSTFDVPYLTVMNAWADVYKRGQSIDWQRVKARVGDYCFATKTPNLKCVPIITSDGRVQVANDPKVEHRSGDYILCGAKTVNNKVVPDFDNMWVVNDWVFEATYDLRGFRNKA